MPPTPITNSGLSTTSFSSKSPADWLTAPHGGGGVSLPHCLSPLQPCLHLYNISVASARKWAPSQGEERLGATDPLARVRGAVERRTPLHRRALQQIFRCRRGGPLQPPSDPYLLPVHRWLKLPKELHNQHTQPHSCLIHSRNSLPLTTTH